MQFLFLFSLNALLSFFQNDIRMVDVQPPAKQEAVCIGVRVSIKVFLEGPYSTDGSRAGSTVGLMTPSLTTPILYVPTASPYGSAPYAYDATTNPTGFKYYTAGAIILGGGGEATTSAILTGSNGTNIGGNAIVDWVFIELRDQTTPATVLETRAALLQADGDVVDTDGTSSVYFSSVNCGSFYVAVRHRNHLGIRTAATEMLSDVTTVVDFTTSSTTYVYGTTPRKTLSNGAFAMYAGNVVHTNALSNIGTRQLKYSGQDNDRGPILTRIGGASITATVTGYYPEDTNMDSVVKYSGANNDRAIILSNIGGASITATLNEQL
jgi:hypothetical protein